MTATLRMTLVLTAALGLQACGERETILQGQRLDPLAVTSPDGPAVDGPAPVGSAVLSLAAPQMNREWTHRAGNAAHHPGHPDLGAGTGRVWSTGIGNGNDKRHRITADPVVGGGLVFTIDSRTQVTATTTGGATVWSRDITPALEANDSVSGGGIAYEGGRVYAASGFGELVALDAASGTLLWRQRVEAPIGGGPAVQNGAVFVIGRNDIGWAVRAADGKVLWQTSGTPSTAGVMGVSVPAVQGSTVIFPFASGQLLAADRETGATLWTAQIGGRRIGRAIANIRDVTGDPVVAGGTVYAGTSSGRINAINLETGIQNWSAREGANSPVAIAGGSVFAVNDQAELVRLDAATGGVIWRRELPYYTTERVRKQDRIHAHFGPVLAGGRLFVVSSDGLMRVFDPGSGNLLGQVDIPGGAATAPAVAGRTIYVVSRAGQLHAFQ